MVALNSYLQSKYTLLSGAPPAPAQPTVLNNLFYADQMDYASGYYWRAVLVVVSVRAYAASVVGPWVVAADPRFLCARG